MHRKTAIFLILVMLISTCCSCKQAKLSNSSVLGQEGSAATADSSDTSLSDEDTSSMNDAAASDPTASGAASTVSRIKNNVSSAGKNPGHAISSAGTAVPGGKSENINNGIKVQSPNGSRIAVLHLDSDGALYLNETADGKAAIGDSKLGFSTDIAEFDEGIQFVQASSVKKINETYTVAAHIKDKYQNHANERTFTFKKGTAQMEVIVRAYDDGIAFRYRISSAKNAAFTVKKELTQIKLDTALVWAMKYTPALEGEYISFTSNGMSGEYSLPLIVNNTNVSGNSGAKYVLLTESVPNAAYSGSKAVGSSSSFNIVSTEAAWTTFPVSSPFVTPWRLLITGNLAEITESTMVTNVADAAQGDYSWVKAGVSSWSWIDVWTDKQNDAAVHKKYIDQAAEMGWSYYIMDHGWQPFTKTDAGNMIQANKYYGWIDEIVSYAKGKGIKLIAWIDKANLENKATREAILKGYADKGIAGIKVDFFNSESPATMRLYQEIYQICAKYKLVVDVHGTSKPTGEERTYPNVIGREAVRGEEYFYITGIQTKQYTILPFVRGVCGPTDVTEYIYPRDKSNTTSGSQIALSVLMYSGIHALPTNPDTMKGHPAQSLYKNFPATWDDTKLLNGEIGSYSVMARRSGSSWYVAGITTNSKKYGLKPTFLTAGKKYKAEIYADNAASGGNILKQIKYSTQEVTSTSTIPVTMLKNGGFVVKLTPIN